ncbi:unnamed protein product [Cochlearia groenlandica]
MLRRAASNAYSWWWASHVRTKQSKWLEENLQDIEEKVQYALKLLEDEGDSFAKRAEMYYKRRPELISFVEESFKAYRALAERYDHISKELQNANTTIASVFPDQVPEFTMNEDDDSSSSSSTTTKPHIDQASTKHNIPKVPHDSASKMFLSRKPIKEHAFASTVVTNKSGLSKTEAVEEIDKLQKEILALQTEKEFVKSSYENSIAKYWEIENSIIEKQGKVCSLQDEFDESVVIENQEAQILMSTTALNSCKEKLEEMRVKQDKNVKETNISRKHIIESTEELGQVSDYYNFLGDDARNHGDVTMDQEKVKEELGVEASSCVTITDVADKIDELVNDVISLENLFSSQAALIHRLREEIDDLKAQIKALKEDNNNTTQAKDDQKMEKKLKGVQNIDKAVQEQSENIEKHLSLALMKLSFLSERLNGLKQEEGHHEDLKATNVPIQDSRTLTEENLDDSVIAKKEEEESETVEKEVSLEKHILSSKQDNETEDEAFLQKLLEHGIEGREKHLLTEYTKVLRNYKEVKRILEETETKLKNENIMKDEQLKILNHKLNLLLEDKTEGDDNDKQKVRSKEQQQQQKDQLFMLIYKEDNVTNAITGQKQILSPYERQFEARVDALLSENLNLLVRFSNSFGQIQQFDTGIKDLHVEILNIIKQKNQEEEEEGGGNNNTLITNVRPIYKHLTEIRTEMTIWLEKSKLLKEEISLRASTLGDIQNELKEALKTDSEDTETKFTIYQGAKFEGEVKNMEKENNRVSDEIQTGLDQVMKLKHEVDKTLEKLCEEFSLSESKNSCEAVSSSSQGGKTRRIPLRSFIFDVKPKKQRLSIFSCIQPSLYKKLKPAGS